MRIILTSSIWKIFCPNYHFNKKIKENNNLELLDNYLLDKDPQEVSKNAPEILMAAELLDAYLLDKRFMRELEDEEYDAA